MDAADRIIDEGIKATSPGDREAAVLALAKIALDNPNEENLRRTLKALRQFMERTDHHKRT